MDGLNRSGLLSLHTYNVYANSLVLETAAQMPVEEITRESSPSHGSVMKLLEHTLGCEYWFLLQCAGTQPDVDADFEESFSALQKNFQKLADRRMEYLETVAENELAAAIKFHAGKGDYVLPRWQLLTQSIIHSVHHRGELSIVMTELGYPLPTLDPILMYIQESGQIWKF